MRKGLNPNKDQLLGTSEFVHQVVIPVHIPNHIGYFEDSLRIFKVCLQSLFKTSHSRTFFTIVSNDSSKEVKTYLDKLFLDGKVQEVIHTNGIGKLNSIIKGLSGHSFEYVTISDADVLFLDNWQAETNQIFESFPKTGVVGLTPQFKQFQNKCGNVLFENFFSKSLLFTEVEDVEGLTMFYKSIGWQNDYNQNYLKQHLTISSQDTKAVVGNGHFVATYKGSLFSELPKFFNAKLGSGSEEFLDEIPLAYGLWKLTTRKNYAYHMGNVFEEWMENVVTHLEGKPENYLPSHFNSHKLRKISSFENWVKNKLFWKFFNFGMIRKIFYRHKKLPRNMAKTY